MIPHDPHILPEEPAADDLSSSLPAEESDLRTEPSTGPDASRKTSAAESLFSELMKRPFSFDWYQAVRRLECANPEFPRVGTSQRVADDIVRFCQEPTLAFAPASVRAVDDGGGGTRARRMTVSFFGMMGPNGPLPLHMTEYARDRMRNSGDHVLVRFFDIFHHRMLSLFYRAWARNQQTVSHDRAADSAAKGPGSSRVVHDRFAMYIASMIGRGERSALNRDDVSDLSKLYYSGRLASSTRNSEGLAAILSSYFSVPCKIEPFVGQWIDLPEESKCHLGRSQETGTLGMTAIVGSRVWDVQSKFRIRLGPMDFETFSSLLPGERGNQELRSWLRNYLDDSFSWEACVVLARDRVPQIRLGKMGKLGCSTWLHAQPLSSDVDDLRISA